MVQRHPASGHLVLRGVVWVTVAGNSGPQSRATRHPPPPPARHTVVLPGCRAAEGDFISDTGNVYKGVILYICSVGGSGSNSLTQKLGKTNGTGENL